MVEIWESLDFRYMGIKPVPCNSVIVIDTEEDGGKPWKSFPVSMASPLQWLLDDNAYDLDGDLMEQEHLIERLAADEIAVVVAKTYKSEPIRLTQQVLQSQSTVRNKIIDARFALHNIALQEVSNIQGCSEYALERIVECWSIQAALYLDVDMELTLGADRQRYVMHDFPLRFRQAVPKIANSLRSVGVQSSPMLVMP